MAEEYSKYKLFRKYKTEDGVNYTPLDEYQALYESGDGVDCSCGYRKYKWKSGNGTESILLNSNTDRTIPMQTFRIDSKDPSNSGYYYIRFTTTPDTDTTDNHNFSICIDEGAIWDNGAKKYITAQTKIDDNIYEYTFSVPVYFSNAEKNAPVSQVTAVTYNYEYNCDYICGNIIIENAPSLTINSVQGSWTRDGYTFTSNTINHNELTIERIYFSVSSPTAVTFTIDQSSETCCDYLVISNLDKAVVSDSPNTTGSSYNYYHHKGYTTGSTSMPISDTNEHFIELMYKKDVNSNNGRDNVIVTLGVIFDYDITSEYEVWREYDYCPNDDTIESLPTGNIEYRNPKKSCGCGYREYEYVWDETWEDAYICGSVLYGETPSLTINSVQGSWTRGGNTFTSNQITHYENTVERIYFSVSEPTTITFTIDQSSENKYDYLIISKLDSGVTNSTTTGSSSPNYAHWSGKTTGTTSMVISDTEEHFVELMYRKDESQSSGRDNVIVTLGVIFDYDSISKYEVWKEKSYCPDSDEYDSYTGNVDYRNPTQSCGCGYREYKWLFSGEEYVCGSDINGLEPYYKYEVWREYDYCPNDDTIESLPTGNIKYLNPILVGQNWVMTTQTKLGSELGEGYEQDKRYILYESYSLCNGELIETEWRESTLVFKTEIEERYIKYEANETYILMGSTVGDIIAHIPNSQYCCESTITGCKQYCYNLYSIYTIDKDGNEEQIYSGRMNGVQVTLRDNENYSYRLYFGDYCGTGSRKAYFTYTLKDEDYHYYMCAVKYQKNDYEDDTKWVEIGYTPRYPSNK